MYSESGFILASVACGWNFGALPIRALLKLFQQPYPLSTSFTLKMSNEIYVKR
jgi:hypothetical protein